MNGEVPQDQDAEQNLLGAVMSGAPDLDDLFELVEPGDFYRPHVGEIWAAIGRVHHAGTRPDPTTVRFELEKSKVRVDPVWLVDVSTNCPLPGNAGHYAEKVLEKAGKRALQAAGARILQIADAPGDLDEARELARQSVEEATTTRLVRQSRTVADLMPAVIDQAERGETKVISTAWPDIDRLIGGLAPGRLIVVGARPGVGKSIMGTNLAIHVAERHGRAAMISSLEMPEQEVGQRLLAAYASVDLTWLQKGTADEAAWHRIAERSQRLGELPISIDDNPVQTVTAIRRSARTVRNLREDLAVVIVDYLQLVAPSTSRGDGTTRAEEVSEISRGLKLLARELGVCVVAMAQLNRGADKHGDARPRMSDLRESGAIEADADQVILLHQPDDEVPEIEAIVDKNRHGPRGVATLALRGYYARLDSVAM